MPQRLRYRYRTCVLVRPWRDTREEAVADALRAGQARHPDAGVDMVWVVGGAIEEGLPLVGELKEPPAQAAAATASSPSARRR